jgi:hypothetical protein
MFDFFKFDFLVNTCILCADWDRQYKDRWMFEFFKFDFLVNTCSYKYSMLIGSTVQGSVDVRFLQARLFCGPKEVRGHGTESAQTWGPSYRQR